MEDVQERNPTLLLGGCNHPSRGLQLPLPAPQLGDPSLAQAWPMKGTHREKRGYVPGNDCCFSWEARVLVGCPDSCDGGKIPTSVPWGGLTPQLQ